MPNGVRSILDPPGVDCAGAFQPTARMTNWMDCAPFPIFPNHTGEQMTAWGHTVGEVWPVRMPSGQQHACHMERVSHCR